MQNAMIYPHLPEIPEKKQSFVIGLTGGIGSGKSTAALFFREAGASVNDADEVAKSILHSDEMRPKLIDLFGEEIFDHNGDLSRERIAGLVFGKPELREQLNQLIHPGVRRAFQTLKDSLSRGEILVYDIPLLFETDQKNNFDWTVVISAPVETRRERVMQRNGWSREEFDRREASQMPLEKKEQLADLVISNIGTNEELRSSVFHVIRHIKAHLL